MSQPEPWLQQLVQQLDDDNTMAIILAGSYARGEFTAFSDVDLICYVKKLPAEKERYTLRYFGDRLVSISFNSITAERRKLTRPETAIWAVPGLRQSRVLLDKEGIFRALQHSAYQFAWDADMQRLADDYASENLVGFAEEAHKIMSGLLRRDDATVLYATYGLALGIIRIVATQRAVFIPTENSYLTAVMRHIGLETAWSYYLQVASGLEEASPRMRGIAALGLYMKTVDLLRPILRPEHAAVVDKTWAIIATSDYHSRTDTDEG
ncbi:MAG: nucleotidyltransferase domain-containing protein [Anaerolineae bacterium]|jgi:hypothetical protein|nr:nucleotidyltransferase domain-containing protein [Anaerolineae bacterium]